MDIIKSVYSVFLQSTGVTTDTRSLKEGNIFIALKGDNFNGNKYAKQALSLGAKAVVVDEDQDITSHKVFRVDDCLKFLQDLANHHRRQLNIPFLAITGSNGKTTTKELINAVLSKKYSTHATMGNYNNHIGVPLTLLQISKETEIAIIEMGANHLEEIAFLCKIAEPTFGYITNFGKAHLEGFGSEENIVKGKSELYRFIRDNSGKVFVDLEDEKQVSLTLDMNRIEFGDSSDADIFITNHSTKDELILGYLGELIKPQLMGSYNFKNASAAIAIGAYFKVEAKKIKKAIEDYEPKMNRSEIQKTQYNTLLMDAYNANPSSMKLSVESFIESNSLLPKAFILGDMFELGKASKKEHQAIVNYLIENDAETVFLVGEQFSKTKCPKTYRRFKTNDDLQLFLKENPIRNHYVLIKGSRGMKLENIAAIL